MTSEEKKKKKSEGADMQTTRVCVLNLAVSLAILTYYQCWMYFCF